MPVKSTGYDPRRPDANTAECSIWTLRLSINGK